MAPKPAPKARKPAAPIPEPEDKTSLPDLSSVLVELHSSDVEAQQQALSRLFAIREYAGAKVTDSRRGTAHNDRKEMSDMTTFSSAGCNQFC